jgi:hypothetical protein
MLPSKNEFEEAKMKNRDELMAATVAAFEQWRANRSHPTQATPKRLCQQAVALLEHFPSLQVISKLNISGTNLKRWAGHGQPPEQNQVTEFITLPTHLDKPEPAQLNLELTFGNGCLMRLCGDISPAQLTAITQSVTRHDGAAL